MAKKKLSEEEVEIVSRVAVDPKEVMLRNLIKAKAPGIFEREPAPAFAQVALDKLVADIISLLN